MHQIAEINCYAAVVFVFCESEVVMELLLLAFLVIFSVFFSFFQFYSVEQCLLQAEILSWNRFITRAHLGYRVPKGTRIINISTALLLH